MCLPLQFSFAAVSAYCGHETGSAAHHDKHHEHQPMADAAHADAGDPEAVGHVDADSLDCHSGGSTAIFGSVHVPQLSAVPWTRIGYAMRVLSAPTMSLPERPNWAALA